MAVVLDRILEIAGLRAPDTITIRNNSDRTISLIAFSRDCRVDLHSEFDVTINLARNISAGQPENVRLNDYHLNGPDNESQIYMLFRAREFPRNVEPLPGEKLFLCRDLAGRNEWNLSLDERGQVDGGPGYALGPAALGANAAAQAALGANAAGPQDESPLERLREEVRQLKLQVEILQRTVADLVTAPRQR